MPGRYAIKGTAVLLIQVLVEGAKLDPAQRDLHCLKTEVGSPLTDLSRLAFTKPSMQMQHTMIETELGCAKECSPGVAEDVGVGRAPCLDLGQAV